MVKVDSVRRVGRGGKARRYRQVDLVSKARYLSYVSRYLSR